MAVLDDLEEVLALLRPERREAPVVEDEHIGLRPAREEPGQRAVAAGDLEFVEEPGHAAVDHGVAFAAGLLPEGAGEVGLPAAGRAGEEEVLALADPLAGGEPAHQRAIEAARMAEVDVLEARACDRAGERAGGGG